MLKFWFIICCFLTGCYFLTSCTTMSEQVLQQRKIGIVQSCYTSLQNGGSLQNIYQYLRKNESFGHISVDQQKILQKCINRTYNSKKWSK